MPGTNNQNSKKKIAEFKISKTESGIQIKFKSEVFNEFFKAKSGTATFRSERPGWSDHLFWKLPSEFNNLWESKKYTISSIGGHPLFFRNPEEPKINISIIRITSTEETTFNFKGSFPDQEIADYIKHAKKAVKDFYESFIMPWIEQSRNA